MSVLTGTHELGPALGDLVLGTTSEGPMARMGHALRILVEDWSGVLEVGQEPAACRLQVWARLASLRALDGHGGAVPLTEEGLRKIESNAAKILDSENHPEVHFVSTATTGSWEQGTVTGELTIHGITAAQSFRVCREPDGGHRLTGTITQSRFGIQPYTAMMGALRLGDDISVDVVVRL